MVVLLCFSTYFFGYALTYLPTCSPTVLKKPFGIQITYGSVFGPCLGMIPLGAALGVILAKSLMKNYSRK
jgi:hypothetical protein